MQNKKMDELLTLYAAFSDGLRAGGMQEPIVLGEGPMEARVLLLGEAPGAEEAKAGRPFVGKAGKNLDAFLAQTGLLREQLFISNVVKFRPYRVGPTGRRANRPPTRAEIAACRDCLLGEIAILRPDWVVTLGNTALQAMLGREATIGQVHGTAQRTEAGQRVFPLYHPASIIYNRALEEVYRQDLCALRAALDFAE